MKICSIVGTRPNFVKEYLLNREFKERGVSEVVVHTGQHYDYEMSRAFFKCFDLPEPDYNLQIQNTDSLTFSANSMVELGKVFEAEQPTCVLGYGDVNSTMSAAIASSVLHIPFIHVEGGIRSSDRRNPEEVNRRISDVLADLIFCCTKTDIINLQKEGFTKDRFELSGDLMNDVILSTLKKYNIVPSRGDYHVLTLHRQENLADEHRLSAILDGLIKADQRMVFPVHPRTRSRLETRGLLAKLQGSKIELLKPMDYVSFVRLAAGANKIITDSGGVRREAYFLHKPCVVLIELSWFPEISDIGWKVLTGPDPDRIADLVNNFEPKGSYQELFGDGMAHQKIVSAILGRYA